MSGEIIPFLFEGSHLVRSVERDDEAWFVGLDVCGILELAKPHQALSRLDDDERGTCSVGTPGGAQNMVVISEAGAFRLVFASRKPVAERFKRWLAHDVLPAIRKTGRYEAVRPEVHPSTSVVMATEDARKENIRTRRQLVSEARQTHGTNAARELWAYLGLPIVPAMVNRAAPELPFTYTAVKHEVEPREDEAA